MRSSSQGRKRRLGLMGERQLRGTVVTKDGLPPPPLLLLVMLLVVVLGSMVQLFICLVLLMVLKAMRE